MVQEVRVAARLQGPAPSGARRGGGPGRGGPRRAGGGGGGSRVLRLLEGRFVGRPGRRRPGVVRAAAASAASAGAATAAATEAAAALTARGTGDLRGGVAERRADLVDLELDDRALLAFLRVEGA